MEDTVADTEFDAREDSVAVPLAVVVRELDVVTVAVVVALIELVARTETVPVRLGRLVLDCVDVALTLRDPLLDGDVELDAETVEEERMERLDVPVADPERLARLLADTLAVLVAVRLSRPVRLFVEDVVEERDTVVDPVVVRELVAVFDDVAVLLPVLEDVEVFVCKGEAVDDLEVVVVRVEVEDRIAVAVGRELLVASEEAFAERLAAAERVDVRVDVAVRVGSAACTAKSRANGCENSIRNWFCGRGGGS